MRRHAWTRRIERVVCVCLCVRPVGQKKNSTEKNNQECERQTPSLFYPHLSATLKTYIFVAFEGIALVL